MLHRFENSWLGFFPSAGQWFDRRHIQICRIPGCSSKSIPSSQKNHTVVTRSARTPSRNNAFRAIRPCKGRVSFASHFGPLSVPTIPINARNNTATKRYSVTEFLAPWIFAEVGAVTHGSAEANNRPFSSRCNSKTVVSNSMLVSPGQQQYQTN